MNVLEMRNDSITTALWLENSPISEQNQNGQRTDEITKDTVTPWYGPALFWTNFVIFFYKITFLVTLL